MAERNWMINEEGGAFVGALTVDDGFRVGVGVNGSFAPTVLVRADLRANTNDIVSLALAFRWDQAQALYEMLAFALNGERE